MANNDDTHNVLKNKKKLNTKQENVKCDNIKRLQGGYDYLFERNQTLVMENAKLRLLLKECETYLSYQNLGKYSNILYWNIKEVLNDNK